LTLSGDISDVELNPSGGIYLVESSIEIPAGKSIQIPAGTVFRFQIGAEFSINGSCTITGTRNDTVIFTSINDHLYGNAPVSNDSSGSLYGSEPASATPFDWEGITVSGSSSGITMRHLLIKYSRNPFTSATSRIVLDSVYRAQTKTPFFMINNTQYNVEDNEAFVFPRITLPETVPDTSSIPFFRRETVKRTFLISGAGALLLSGGFTIGSMIKDIKRNEAIDHYSDNSSSNFSYRRDEADHANKLESQKQKLGVSALVSGIVGAVLLSGFSVSFFF
jgi:hypothetical protein